MAHENATPVHADGPYDTVACILASHFGRPVPTERDRVVAAEIVEALTAEHDRLANENAMLRRAMTVSAMYLGTGFIECGRCGEEVETKHTDAEYTLRGALSQDRPA